MLFGNPKEAGDISFPLRKKDELSCRKLVEETVVYGHLWGGGGGVWVLQLPNTRVGRKVHGLQSHALKQRVLLVWDHAS